MPAKRRLTYRGIIFTIEPADAAGLSRFRFEIDGREIQGRTQTNLAGMAIKRAKSATIAGSESDVRKATTYGSRSQFLPNS
jgi:hypothetical protein